MAMIKTFYLAPPPSPLQTIPCTHTHAHTQKGRHIDDFAVNEIEQLLSHCIMGLFHTQRAEQKQFFPSSHLFSPGLSDMKTNEIIKDVN